MQNLREAGLSNDVKCFVANELKYHTDNAQEKQLTWSLSKTLPTKAIQMSVSFEQYTYNCVSFGAPNTLPVNL